MLMEGEGEHPLQPHKWNHPAVVQDYQDGRFYGEKKDFMGPGIAVLHKDLFDAHWKTGC